MAKRELERADLRSSPSDRRNPLGSDQLQLSFSPFGDSHFHAIQLDGQPVLNFISFDLQPSECGIYGIIANTDGDALKRKSPLETKRLSWDGASSQSLLRSVLSVSASRYIALYLITTSPVLSLIQHAYQLISPRARRSRIAAASAASAARAASAEASEVEEGDKIVMRSGLEQSGEGMTLRARYAFRPIVSKAVAWPMTCAALYASRFSDSVSAGEEVASAALKRGYVLSVHASAANERAFISRIEEAVREIETPFDLQPTSEREALDLIYRSPLLAYSLYSSKEGMPTEASLAERRGALMSGIAEYARLFSESLRGYSVASAATTAAAESHKRASTSIIAGCDCAIRLPSMQSEEAFHLATRAELALIPRIVDQELCLARHRASVSDTLFDKVYHALDESSLLTASAVDAAGGAGGAGAGSKAAGKCKARYRDLLAFSYGDLLDAGQIFTYGECAELAARLQLLA